MIVGVGFDAVRVGRVARLESRYGRKLAARLLVPEEIALWEARGGRATRFLAGRFAAKEAVVKALGTGFARGLGFQAVAVLPDGAGAPRVRLFPPARAVAEGRGIARIELSLSDEDGWVFALALALAA